MTTAQNDHIEYKIEMFDGDKVLMACIIVSIMIGLMSSITIVILLIKARKGLTRLYGGHLVDMRLFSLKKKEMEEDNVGSSSLF